MPDFPELITNRFLLRQFRDNDIDNVFKALSDPDVIRYYGVHYESLESAKEQMVFFKDLEKNKTGVWWAICSKQGNEFYGAAGFNNLRQEHKRAEIGFWLLPEFWGNGFVSEVLPVICAHGYDQLGLHRIEALVETENSNSRKVLEKLKFNYEGTMRDYEIKDGRFISLDIFAKFA